MDLNTRVTEFINNYKKEKELIENEIEINLINQIIKYKEFENKKEELKLKENEEYKNKMKSFIYSEQKFYYHFFEKYYENKIKSLEILNTKNYNIEEGCENINKKLYDVVLFCKELQKVNRFIKYYKLKYDKLLKNLIKINFIQLNNFNKIKKVLGTIYFKNEMIKCLYSNYKRFYYLFNENQKIVKELNNNSKLIEDNIFDIYDREYNYDKTLSSGEKIVNDILFKLYKENTSFLFYYYEYVLPVKFIKNLRADFFCLVVDKNKCIRKIVIEINGEQHYTFNTFFDDKTLFERDKLKKEYCDSNNILFIAVDYTKLHTIHSVFDDLLF